MPRFSLIIPTLRRPDTLRHSLATLVNQQFEDFEIIVQNNGRDKATEDVIESFKDSRIRHCWSDQVLLMADNWEAAVANAKGDYITVVGDDDGLFPEACKIASAVIDRTNAEILSWRPFSYYWPSHMYAGVRGRLIADVEQQPKIVLVPSRAQLRKFYGFALHYAQLPMIYNSFVSRATINRVIARAGRYFLGILPDVASGIVNAECSETFALITRPLSISGISGHSIGFNVTLSPPGWQSAERIKGGLGVEKTDPRLVATSNLELMIAENALTVRQQLFPQDAETEFDFRRLIQNTASAINDRPGFYEVTYAAIAEMAEKNGIALSEIAIPKETKAEPELVCGTVVRGPGHECIILDGSRHGLSTIVDAVAYAGKLMPEVRDVDKLKLVEDDTGDRAVLPLSTKVVFAKGGSGEAGLDYGWGETERWGVWSVGKSSYVRLLRQPPTKGAAELELCFRAFVQEKNGPIELRVFIGGEAVRAIRVSAGGSQIHKVTMLNANSRDDGTIDLEFRIVNPCSPAELGLSQDTRLLGIGLEWVTLKA